MGTVAVAGETATEASGPMTVITAVPRCPSLVAVIVTLPGAPPVTRPVDAPTVATLGVGLAQVTGRPVMESPTASLSIAVSRMLPLGIRVHCIGITDTDATGPTIVWPVVNSEMTGAGSDSPLRS